MRGLLQQFRLTRVLGMDAEGEEEPKAKRPCVEEEKESNSEENGAASAKKEVRNTITHHLNESTEVLNARR